LGLSLNRPIVWLRLRLQHHAPLGFYIGTTKLNNEARELKTEELNAVSGGRIKIEVPAAVKAWEIAQIERDNPGF